MGTAEITGARQAEGIVLSGRAALSERRSYALQLAGAVALAAGLRLIFWWMQARSGAVQPGDSEEYYRGALSILLRSPFATGTKWLRPPLYPLILAATLSIARLDLARAMLVQALITGVGVLAFAALGRALFGRRDVAVVSALIGALFVPLAAYGSVLFAEALFVVLIAIFFALILAPIHKPRATYSRAQGRRGRLSRAALAGLVFGLATLTRAVGLFFLPLACLALVLEHRLAYGSADRRWLHPAIAQAVIMVLVALLTIAPWTIRNAVAYHRFVPVDTNGGISFWYGTLADDRELAQGEAALARIPNLADKQRTAVGFALGDIARDPARYLTRVRYKIASLWQLSTRNYAAGGIVSFDPDGHSLGLTPGELPLPLAIVGDLEYLVLVVGGIWGFCLAPRRRRSALLLLWLVFGTILSALTTAHPRLRLPLLITFVPYAAWLLLALPGLRRRSWRLRWRSLGAALLLTAAFLGTIYTQQYSRFARAELLVWRGDRSSPAVFERAYAANPANPLWLMAAADRQVRKGDWAGAQQTYGRAAGQEQRSLYAHVRLMQGALERGNSDEATRQFGALRDLGRDTNDLLLWAWSRLDVRPQARLTLGRPEAIGSIVGFGPALPQSGERWSQATARVRLAATTSCRQLAIEMRGYEQGQPVAVEAGGHTTTFHVGRTSSVYHLPLDSSDCRRRSPLEITLRTPVHAVDQERAAGPEGVAVSKVDLE